MLLDKFADQIQTSSRQRLKWWSCEKSHSERIELLWSHRQQQREFQSKNQICQVKLEYLWWWQTKRREDTKHSSQSTTTRLEVSRNTWVWLHLSLQTYPILLASKMVVRNRAREVLFENVSRSSEEWIPIRCKDKPDNIQQWVEE